MEQSDLIVIGAGPGGYLAAERAAQGGLAVTLFEGEHIGGTCLNVGCIPSKALLHSAKTYLHVAADGEACGIIADHIRVDHKKVLARKDRVVKTLVSGVEMQLKRQKVRVVRQQAYILGKREGGFAVRAGETEYLAARMIIAAGSVPLTPPIEGLQESIASGFALTNETIFDEKSVPRRLVVLGGGVIGMEMASYFRTAGSEVIVVEMLKNLGGNIGAQMSTLLQQELEKRGFEIHLGCRASKVGKGEVEYLDETGTVHSIKADRVLVSLGRRARLSGYGLENLRVETTRQGIAVNERMETSVPGIYAVGDVNGRVPLAHTAYREAEVAVNNILGKKDAMDYGVIPSVLYTDPEISCVGETPESAEKKGYAVKTVTLPMQYSGRYVAEVDNGKGVCTVVYDTKRDRLLGVQVCATGSSEFIYGAEAFIGMKIPLERLRKLIFPHPTTGEIIREALFEL